MDTLKEKFPCTYKFSKREKDKFILLLRKGVYPYDYMDSWERFSETKLTDKKSFYNKLNQEASQIETMNMHAMYGRHTHAKDG